jgi:hypothetical protein
MTEITELRVERNNLRHCEIARRHASCNEGEALLAVERFALTANNVTYAVAGDAMNYWKFFPVPDSWGCVPVWGFGRVVESRCQDVNSGDRFYGYYPMASHVVVAPARVGPQGFVDAATHRAALPPVYNQYRRVDSSSRDDENAEMLLRPLFMTSFLIDDYLDDNAFFGARSVVVSSASSKTSIGLAFELSRRPRGSLECVGLTSGAHRSWVESLGYYDRCVPYGGIETLDREVPTVFVDIAGDGGVLRRVHEHVRDALRHTCSVGVTHWEAAERSAPVLPGPRPSLFFAPTRIQKRRADWGPGGLDERLGRDWTAFVTATRDWLSVAFVAGPDAMRAAYLEMLEGRTPPSRGVVIAPAG